MLQKIVKPLSPLSLPPSSQADWPGGWGEAVEMCHRPHISPSWAGFRPLLATPNPLHHCLGHKLLRNLTVQRNYLRWITLLALCPLGVPPPGTLVQSSRGWGFGYVKTVVAKMDSKTAGPSTLWAPSGLPEQVIDASGMLFRDSYFCSVTPLGTCVS